MWFLKRNVHNVKDSHNTLLCQFFFRQRSGGCVMLRHTALSCFSLHSLCPFCGRAITYLTSLTLMYTEVLSRLFQ